mgnify:CR=1 FL=1
MFLNTLGKNEMYHSVAEIMGTDIEHIKEYVKENADDIVGCGYNEYCIENMSLIKLIEKCGTHPQVIDRLIVHHITPRECEETIWTRIIDFVSCVNKENCVIGLSKRIRI